MDSSMTDVLAKNSKGEIITPKWYQAKTVKKALKAKPVSTSKRSYYPASQEYGTKHMAANPFMRPAFDHKRGAVP